MRVISGTFRSRLLQEVPSEDTRETKDRVKESIFNSLSNDLIEATVLDLFAGSGSLGIEAISRGSKSVVFVDHNHLAIDVVKANIETLGITNQTTVFQEDYSTFLRRQKASYDIILLDPPYNHVVLDEIIFEISQQELLSPHGIIVCLYGKNNKIKPENNGIIEYKKKTIGITNVSFMKWGI